MSLARQPPCCFKSPGSEQAQTVNYATSSTSEGLRQHRRARPRTYFDMLPGARREPRQRPPRGYIFAVLAAPTSSVLHVPARKGHIDRRPIQKGAPPDNKQAHRTF
eukprot:601454-Alexandrium_andersonii.AAC.1